MLQKVATDIAIKGLFLISVNIGIEGAESFDGASCLMYFNSFIDKDLLSSGNEVTFLSQKKYQKIPNIPKE